MSLSNGHENAVNLYLREIRDGALDEVTQRYQGGTYAQDLTGVPEGQEGF